MHLPTDIILSLLPYAPWSAGRLMLTCKAHHKEEQAWRVWLELTGIDCEKVQGLLARLPSLPIHRKVAEARQIFQGQVDTIILGMGSCLRLLENGKEIEGHRVGGMMHDDSAMLNVLDRGCDVVALPSMAKLYHIPHEDYQIRAFKPSGSYIVRQDDGMVLLNAPKLTLTLVLFDCLDATSMPEGYAVAQRGLIYTMTEKGERLREVRYDYENQYGFDFAVLHGYLRIRMGSLSHTFDMDLKLVNTSNELRAEYPRYMHNNFHPRFRDHHEVYLYDMRTGEERRVCANAMWNTEFFMCQNKAYLFKPPELFEIKL